MSEVWLCDHCHKPMHRDINGWWAGEDGTSDCDAWAEGHTVDGSTR